MDPDSSDWAFAALKKLQGEVGKELHGERGEK